MANISNSYPHEIKTGTKFSVSSFSSYELKASLIKKLKIGDNIPKKIIHIVVNMSDLWIRCNLCLSSYRLVLTPAL